MKRSFCVLYFLVLIGCDVEDSPNWERPTIEEETVETGGLSDDTEVPEAVNTGGDLDTDTKEVETPEILPNPKYVLWDKFGKPVDAMVSPYWSDLWEDPFVEKIKTGCFWVQFLGRRHVGLYFDMETGNPYMCSYLYTVSASTRESSAVFFLNAWCDGPGHYIQRGLIKIVGDKFVYTGGLAEESSVYYRWDPKTNTCVAYENIAEYSFYRWGEVPGSVLDSFSDYPYSMTVEY